MPKSRFPNDFSKVVLDAEIDLKDRGGILRFRTVRDLEDWLDAEKDFWAFLTARPAASHMGHWNRSTTFFTYDGEIRANLNNLQSGWPGWVESYEQSRAAAKASPDDQASKDAIANWQRKLEERRANLKSHVETILKTEIVDTARHMWRGEPWAQRLKDLSDEQPIAVAYALDSLLIELARSGDQRAEEPLGRIAAALIILNADPAMAGAFHLAFAEAIQSWTKELSGYRSEYEGLKDQFSTLTGKLEEAWNKWEEKVSENSTLMTDAAKAAKAEVDEEVTKAEANLRNLTEHTKSTCSSRGR